ncbi:hypothetical protein [Lactiplantibacillus herbarum]|uniref:hypothetical protein n=1 Tax=Lactiplantibacillus herbarum TaxID=1670446 RepID=UPI00064F16BE|nr:hypothetical protein [Lactiplantibacillus herbarum]
MAEDFHEMDEKETEWVMNRFISETHGKYLRKVLNSFAEKRGYSHEYIYIWFYYDNDGDEDSDEKLRMLDNKHVLIEQDYSISFTGKDDFVYLDFPTFYKYLAHEINKRAKRNPKSADLIDLLAKVKESLGV